MSETNDPPSDFASARTKASKNIVSEFLGFLGHTKKWWLLPIILVLLTLGLLIIAAGSGIAPFIYSLF